jgi:hypothetical protein
MCAATYVIMVAVVVAAGRSHPEAASRGRLKSTLPSATSMVKLGDACLTGRTRRKMSMLLSFPIVCASCNAVLLAEVLGHSSGVLKWL